VGTGAGNAEKDTPPQAVERGGAGKRAGGPHFSGPRPPRNELYPCSSFLKSSQLFPGYILSSFDVWRSPFQRVSSQKAKRVDNFVVVVVEFPSYSFEVD